MAVLGSASKQLQKSMYREPADWTRRTSITKSKSRGLVAESRHSTVEATIATSMQYPFEPIETRKEPRSKIQIARKKKGM